MINSNVLQRAVVICITLLAMSASTGTAGVEFIYPSANSWVSRSGHLILKFNQVDLTAARITVNGISSEMMDIGSPEYRKLFKDFFIAQALWDTGKNSLQIDIFKGGQKIETASTNIFFIASDASLQAPPEFSPTIMHIPEKERLCVSCHNLNPTPAQMNSSIDKDNPCFSCHKRMLNLKYVHGPAGTYSCGYCHSSKGKPKHTVPKRGSALCYECHSDMDQQIRKRAFIHGPVEAGMCETCHDSHGSPFEYQLTKPVNELCLSCHGHIRNQTHVVRTTTGEGHPLSNKPDPSKKNSGKEMSCISCHNPHGGDVRFFFVNNAEERMLLCQMCHNK